MASKTERAQVDLIINGEVANKAMRDLEAAARKAKSELRGLAPDSARFKELSGSLEKINKELDATKVKAGLAQSSWAKMKQTIESTFIGNLGANLATAGLGKVSGYIMDSFDAAKKLSDQLADVRKTTGMTADEAQRLRTQLTMIDTRTSMSDLMDIAKVGGQFGVAKDQVYDFVKAVDITSVALGDEFTGGAEQVATEMAKLRNIFKDIKTDDIGTDVGFISNAINVLASAGVATGPVVSDLANRIGGYGIQVGLTSGQTLGLSATLQELGVSSERGGTAVVKILQKMLTNSTDFAKIAGVEVGKFKTMLNTDLYGAFIKVMEGSKKLGPNASLLAGIVKDLEVQGAGASEVFAKLGSNTEMLSQKAEMATEALTNTASITQEFDLRNENLAGSVEHLSKEWSKLTANPAMVTFFKTGIDLTRKWVEGTKELVQFLHVSFAVFTGNAAEVRMKQLQAKQDEHNAIMREKQRKDDAEAIAVYKQQVNKMDKVELEAEYASLENRQQKMKKDMAFYQKAGNEEYFYITLKNYKFLEAEKSAVEKVQAARLDATKKGNEELSAEEKRAIAKKAREQQQELNRVYKLQMNHYDDLIKLAEKSRDEELKLLIETNKTKFKAIGDEAKKELDAAIELMGLTAKTTEEKVVAIQQEYLLKKMAVTEGSYQYKLLVQQELNAISEIEKNAAKESVKTEKERIQENVNAINGYINLATGILSIFNARQKQVDENRLTAQRKQDQKELDQLKYQLDNKILTQEQYDQKVTALNATASERERKQRKESAEFEKQNAVFIAALKAGLAWVEAYLNPLKVPQAILATAEAISIAATPIPEYYTGGYMPNSSNDRDAFPIIAHANEYMVDAKSARDPYVMNTIGLIEQSKSAGVAPNTLAAQQGIQQGSNNQSQTIYKDTPEMIELLKQVSTLLSNGIDARIVPTESGLRTWEDETQKKLGTFRSKNGKDIANKNAYLFKNNWL